MVIPPGAYLMRFPGTCLEALAVHVVTDHWHKLSVRVPSGNLHPLETFPEGTILESVKGSGRGGEGL